MEIITLQFKKAVIFNMPFDLNLDLFDLPFNWLDPAIIILLIFALWQGGRVGLLKSFFNILGLTLGVALATYYYSPLALLILRYFSFNPVMAEIISFVMIFLFIAVLINLVGSIFYAVTKLKIVKAADKLGGSLIWLAISFFLIGLLLNFFVTLPVHAQFPDLVEDSFTAQTTMKAALHLFYYLAEILPFNLPALALCEPPLLASENSVIFNPLPKNLHLKGGTPCSFFYRRL